MLANIILIKMTVSAHLRGLVLPENMMESNQWWVSKDLGDALSSSPYCYASSCWGC